MSIHSRPELQYALDNFAGIVKNLEFYENNFEFLITLPQDIAMLATCGYYISLGQLIKNKQGMDYKIILELLEDALTKNTDYPDQNLRLEKNIVLLKQWERSLEDEMDFILNIRDKYYAHIDWVEKDFLVKQFENKDTSKQNDLVKFFRSIIDVATNYSTAVLQAFAKIR